MNLWLQDLRFGARMLRRKPGATLVAALTLALGIGAAATLASIVHTVFFVPLPYPHLDRLVFVWESFPQGGYDQLPVSGADFLDFRQRVDAFERLAAFQFVDRALTSASAPVEVQGLAVSTDFLPLMGIQPAIGRAFTPSDEEGRSGAVVILGDRLWREAFGADPGIVGRVIQLSGRPHEVVGVLPGGFRGPPPFTMSGQTYSPTGDIQLLLPLHRSDLAADRERHNEFVVGRLAPGVGLHQASGALGVVMADLSKTYPEVIPAGMTATATGVQDQAAARSRPTLLIFLGASILILTVACANVASLLLARAVGRGREMMVRTALGAQRGGLIRQLLIESVLLALVGGALGAVLTWWTLRILPSLGFSWIPRLDEVHLDLPTLGVILLVTVAVGVVFGLAPAFHVSRSKLATQLQDNGWRGRSEPSRLRLQEAFVVLQLAVALSLLGGAGLVVKSLWRVQQVDPGFDPVGRATVSMTLPEYRYRDAASLRTAAGEILARVRALPEVETAGAANTLPLVGLMDGTRFAVEGHEPPEGEDLAVATKLEVTPDFVEAMGIRLLRGRTFSTADRQGGRPVAMVNEELVRRVGLASAAEAVGRSIRLGPRDSDRFVTVVGVVADVRLTDLLSEPTPTIYVPFDQDPGRRLVLVASSPRPAISLSTPLRETVWSYDHDLVIETSSLQDTLRLAEAEPRINSLFLSAVASFALLLGAVGVAGVTGYNVHRRRRELGIRLALGATHGRIMALLVGHGLKLAAAGIVLGLLGAWGLARVVAHLLFGVTPEDPLTWIAVTLILLAIVVAATYLPARRLVWQDPSDTLDEG